MGLVRMRVLAHFFGVSALGDVWAAAMKGPNIVQNLLGEQSLSAAFIPVYVRKLAAGEPQEAARFAGAILALLLVLLSAVALAGVLLAGPIVSILNTGLLLDAEAVVLGTQEIDRFPLTVRAVRIIFPTVCILVLSAWCIGILNSHGRFLLSYMAPAMWSASIIAVVVWVGSSVDAQTAPGGSRLLIAACVGALGGSMLQLAVQLPTTLKLLGGLRLSLSRRVSGVGETLRLFGPALVGRGAAQLSGYVDLFVAGFLAVGSLSVLLWAQALYLLPISLFGLSVAAVELPAMTREVSEGGRIESIGSRIESGFRQMAFLTVPTSIGYLCFGHLLVGALYRSGSFGLLDNGLVYLVLAAYSLGIPATTTSRLLQTAFFAMKDTRTPARIAYARLAIGGVVGTALAVWLNGFSAATVLGIESARTVSLGAVGLAAASVVAGWVELGLLLRALRGQELPFRLAWPEAVKLVGLSVAAALPAAFVWRLTADWAPLLSAPVVLGVFAALYVVLASASGVDEATSLLHRIPALRPR